MMIYSKRQMSDTFLIAVLLAVLSGSLDAYSYVARGHVFANAQTGISSCSVCIWQMANGCEGRNVYYPCVCLCAGYLHWLMDKKFISCRSTLADCVLFEIAMLSIVAAPLWRKA